MREILFRGKRTDNGKWVEGYYQKRYDDFDDIQHLIFYSKSSTVWEYVEVDPETVCQYTGLTDKNGRKIFEWDCLGHELNVVEYLNGCFTVSGDRPLSLMAKHNEVIGNIFDKE